MAVAVLLIAGFLWLKNPASLVPDRAAATAAEMTASEDKLYILLVGSDENEGILGSGRADTIVASLDIKTKDLFFLSIPRDSMWPLRDMGMIKSTMLMLMVALIYLADGGRVVECPY